MTKKQKRKARLKIKKLFNFLTSNEKKALNKSRKREPFAIRNDGVVRPGVKQWILENNPERLREMYAQGLLKKVSKK